MSDTGDDATVWTKVCPNCSVQSQTAGDYCPSCGKSYTRKPVSPRRKRVALSLALVALVALAAVAVMIKVRHDNEVEAAQAASERASARAEAVDQEQARKRADARAAKQASNDRKREVRRLLIKELQKSVTKDARKSVSQGVLDGPIFSTQCTPVGGGSTDDLTAITGKFECLAVNKRNTDGTVEGYVYSSTVDWNKFSYSWQLGR